MRVYQFLHRTFSPFDNDESAVSTGELVVERWRLRQRTVEAFIS